MNKCFQYSELYRYLYFDSLMAFEHNVGVWDKESCLHGCQLKIPKVKMGARQNSQFQMRQICQFWKRDKTAHFKKETKPPILKRDKTAYFACEREQTAIKLFSLIRTPWPNYWQLANITNYQLLIQTEIPPPKCNFRQFLRLISFRKSQHQRLYQNPRFQLT